MLVDAARRRAVRPAMSLRLDRDLARPRALALREADLENAVREPRGHLLRIEPMARREREPPNPVADVVLRVQRDQPLVVRRGDVALDRQRVTLELDVGAVLRHPGHVGIDEDGVVRLADVYVRDEIPLGPRALLGAQDLLLLGAGELLCVHHTRLLTIRWRSAGASPTRAAGWSASARRRGATPRPASRRCRSAA